MLDVGLDACVRVPVSRLMSGTGVFSGFSCGSWDFSRHAGGMCRLWCEKVSETKHNIVTISFTMVVSTNTEFVLFRDNFDTFFLIRYSDFAALCCGQRYNLPFRICYKFEID